MGDDVFVVEKPPRRRRPRRPNGPGHRQTTRGRLRNRGHARCHLRRNPPPGGESQNEVQQTQTPSEQGSEENYQIRSRRNIIGSKKSWTITFIGYLYLFDFTSFCFSIV